jgi:hypothetical protein
MEDETCNTRGGGRKYKIQGGKSKGKDHLGDLGIDRRITFK